MTHFVFEVISVSFVNGWLKLYYFAFQVTDFWNNVLKADERERMAQNIGLNLKDAQPFLQKRVVRINFRGECSV